MSVVIPCYNHARYLNDAIESVLMQSYARIEILVVDDGSTDNTAEVVARYIQVQYVHQPNLGLAEARNTGLRKSHGEYIAFLDADDLFYTDALMAGIQCFDKHHSSAFVYGGFSFVTDKLLFIKARFPNPSNANHIAFLRTNQIGTPGAVLYRRQILELLNGFDTSVPACADYDLYLRITKCHKIACHNGMVVKYRRHADNMSNNHKRMLLEMKAVFAARKPDRNNSYSEYTAWRHGRIRYQQNYGYLLLKKATSELVTKGKRVEGMQELAIVVFHAPWAFWAQLKSNPRFAMGQSLIFLFADSFRKKLRNIVLRLLRID